MARSAVRPAALGLRAQKGGAVAVGLALDAGEPRFLLSTLIPTHTPGDPLAHEPYHRAAEAPRGADGRPSAEAAKIVAEGRARQVALATEAIGRLVAALRAACGATPVAALLVNRAGWVTDLLEYSLAWPEHAAVAEGLAVRDALRAALAAGGIACIELDEKALPDRAALTLDRAPGAIDATIRRIGDAAGRPWRKEQKMACLAAWIAAHGEC